MLLSIKENKGVKLLLCIMIRKVEEIIEQEIKSIVKESANEYEYEEEDNEIKELKSRKCEKTKYIDTRRMECEKTQKDFYRHWMECDEEEWVRNAVILDGRINEKELKKNV